MEQIIASIGKPDLEPALASVSTRELDEVLEAEAHQSDPSKGASLSLHEAVRRREE